MCIWSVFVNLTLHLKQQRPETHPCGSYGKDSKKKTLSFGIAQIGEGLIFAFQKLFKSEKPQKLNLTLFEFDTFLNVKNLPKLQAGGEGKFWVLTKRKSAFSGIIPQV